MTNKKAWTNEEEAQLLILRDQELSYKEMADKLGRSIPSIRSKLHSIKQTEPKAPEPAIAAPTNESDDYNLDALCEILSHLCTEGYFPEELFNKFSRIEEELEEEPAEVDLMSLVEQYMDHPEVYRWWRTSTLVDGLDEQQRAALQEGKLDPDLGREFTAKKKQDFIDFFESRGLPVPIKPN